MPEWVQQLWKDIRPNFLWWIITVLTGGLVTAIAWLDQPVTVTKLTLTFIAASVFLGLLILGLLTARNRISQRKARYLMTTILTYLPLMVGAAFCIWWYFIGVKVFQLSADVELMQKQIARYVLPRRLTQEQKNIISEYLSKSEPQSVVMKVIPRNEEAGSYRADLQQALEKGGWPVSNIIYDDTIQEGLNIDLQEPMVEPGQESPFDRLKPKVKPVDRLVEALNEAGVVMSGHSGGSSRSITSPVITILIGNRRRDKWAIPPSRRQGRLPELPDDPDAPH